MLRGPLRITAALACCSRVMATISAAAADGNYYRSDGVRITHDPSAPEMAAKYGRPGGTDRDGFDPYADSVGAGIYGGTVERGADGSVTIGRQYQQQSHST